MDKEETGTGRRSARLCRQKIPHTTNAECPICHKNIPIARIIEHANVCALKQEKHSQKKKNSTTSTLQQTFQQCKPKISNHGKRLEPTTKYKRKIVETTISGIQIYSMNLDDAPRSLRRSVELADVAALESVKNGYVSSRSYQKMSENGEDTSKIRISENILQENVNKFTSNEDHHLQENKTHEDLPNERCNPQVNLQNDRMLPSRLLDSEKLGFPDRDLLRKYTNVETTIDKNQPQISERDVPFESQPTNTVIPKLLSKGNKEETKPISNSPSSSSTTNTTSRNGLLNTILSHDNYDHSGITRKRKTEEDAFMRDDFYCVRQMQLPVPRWNSGQKSVHSYPSHSGNQVPLEDMSNVHSRNRTRSFMNTIHEHHNRSSRGIPSDTPSQTDATIYIEKMKAMYATQPQTYKKFFQLLRDFKQKDLSAQDVIEAVAELFQGKPELLIGFERFLPPGYYLDDLVSRGILSREQLYSMHASNDATLMTNASNSRIRDPQHLHSNDAESKHHSASRSSSRMSPSFQYQQHPHPPAESDRSSKHLMSLTNSILSNGMTTSRNDSPNSSHYQNLSSSFRNNSTTSHTSTRNGYHQEDVRKYSRYSYNSSTSTRNGCHLEDVRKYSRISHNSPSSCSNHIREEIVQYPSTYNHRGEQMEHRPRSSSYRDDKERYLPLLSSLSHPSSSQDNHRFEISSYQGEQRTPRYYSPMENPHEGQLEHHHPIPSMLPRDSRLEQRNSETRSSFDHVRYTYSQHKNTDRVWYSDHAEASRYSEDTTESSNQTTNSSITEAGMFISKVNDRLRDEPAKYKSFLAIILQASTLRSSSPNLQKIVAEVARIFDSHQDLLQEFHHYLPGGLRHLTAAQSFQLRQENSNPSLPSSVRGVPNLRSQVDVPERYSQNFHSFEPQLPRIHSRVDHRHGGMHSYSSHWNQNDYANKGCDGRNQP